jgi:hypothetical protein
MVSGLGLRAVKEGEMKALLPRVDHIHGMVVDSQESLLSFRMNTALVNYHELCSDARKL